MKIFFMSSFLAISVLGSFIPNEVQAALKLVGPIDQANGFPKWYKDNKNLRLTLCLDHGEMCALEDVTPDRPVSFPDNFPGEAFWWSAEAELSLGGRAEVLVVMALEAAFANEIPQAGDRVAFGRIRVRARGLPSGTYRIIHPYGSDTYKVVRSDSRQINETSDIGISPEDFSGAVKSGIGPFLVWDPAIAPKAPKGFIGNPAVPHEVVGSPRGTNFVRLQRLTGGVFKTVAFTRKFNVLGKKAPMPEEPVLSASPKGGTIRRTTNVTLKTSVPGAKIFYTLDGSDPFTSTTRKAYTTPIVLKESAIITFGGMNQTARSELVTERYVKVE